MTDDAASWRLWAAAGILVLLIVASPFLLERYAVDTTVRDFTASVSVVPSTNNTSLDVGVDPGRTMAFGRVSEGVTLRKFVEINATEPQWVRITTSGAFSEYAITPPPTRINASHEFGIEFQANETGNYSGKVHIETQQSAGGLGGQWLDLKYWFLQE